MDEQRKHLCCNRCGHAGWYYGCYCGACLEEMRANWEQPGTAVDDEPPVLACVLPPENLPLPDCPYCTPERPCERHYISNTRLHAGYGNPSTTPLDDPDEFTSSWALARRAYEQDIENGDI